MFPTGLTKAKHADVGGHFIVDKRPIRPVGPTPDAVWPDMATQPQNNFVDVSDGKIGVAFLNDSLTEYEVMDNEERTVALSLLRSVRNWICTERQGSEFPSQKGGQSLRHHSMRYAIRPHAGNWKEANVPLAAEKFNVPPRPVQTRKHDGTLPKNEGSLFVIDNEALRFATLKKAEDRNTSIVRVYNPTAETQKGNIAFNTPVTRAWYTNLNEKREKEIKPTKTGKVPIAAAPMKIVTVEIKN
jgi:mannosylglycerate hydrolase